MESEEEKMTDREKLVKLTLLIDDVAEGTIIRRGGEWVSAVNSEEIAAHLLDHGVTVKEPQKPLTVEEVHAKQNEIMYLEYAQNKLEEFPVLLTFFGAFYAEFEKYGGEGADFLIDEYNYKWRCWAEKPTEEERKAAEWL
jgi:hypothetical protein